MFCHQLPFLSLFQVYFLFTRVLKLYISFVDISVPKSFAISLPNCQIRLCVARKFWLKQESNLSSQRALSPNSDNAAPGHWRTDYQ